MRHTMKNLWPKLRKRFRYRFWTLISISNTAIWSTSETSHNCSKVNQIGYLCSILSTYPIFCAAPSQLLAVCKIKCWIRHLIRALQQSKLRHFNQWKTRLACFKKHLRTKNSPITNQSRISIWSSSSMMHNVLNLKLPHRNKSSYRSWYPTTPLQRS